MLKANYEFLYNYPVNTGHIDIGFNSSLVKIDMGEVKPDKSFKSLK